MKNCTKCLTDKDENEFYESGRLKADGTVYLLPSCKQCFADYYEANKERQKLSNRRAVIKRRYGLTLEEYDALVAGGCTVCNRDDVRIIMDHCHATNAVRAPLCDGCNVALGGARDDPKILRSLADYLERHTA